MYKFGRVVWQLLSARRIGIKYLNFLLNVPVIFIGLYYFTFMSGRARNLNRNALKSLKHRIPRMFGNFFIIL